MNMECLDSPLIIIMGHSGSGKTSVMREVMNNELVSVTTRPMREGEVESEDYYFISKKEMKELRDNGELIEYVAYGNHEYGITRYEFNKKMRNGHTFVIAERKGAEQLQEFCSNYTTIMLAAPREQTEERLRKRGESEETIATRMSTYDEELSNKSFCDYVVMNNDGDFYKTCDKVARIIKTEIEKAQATSMEKKQGETI